MPNKRYYDKLTILAESPPPPPPPHYSNLRCFEVAYKHEFLSVFKCSTIRDIIIIYCFSSSSEEENITKKADQDSNSTRRPFRNTSSLLDFLTTFESTFESTPGLSEYGLIGVRPWSSFQEEAGIPCCLYTFVQKCLLLNVQKTEHISFSSHVYLGEDVDFQVKLIEKNISLCRLEHFSFMEKIASRVSWRGVDNIPPNPSPESELDIFSHLVVPPDMDTMKTINADANLVLQRYLSLIGPKLFPLALDKPEVPVLMYGAYLNLGPHINVCVGNDEKTSKYTTFSGLIIYNCSKDLTKDRLSQFQFVKDAQLVFVCKERYELRAEVLRLDLEDMWRFRLRDEYQTANVADGDHKSLYFLTGSYFGS